jgi:4-amino-4-deoxy-L-arabinose transferase-like glycosyltransferase
MKIIGRLNKVLLTIVFLAFLLRVVGIGSFPTGFTPDEASFGYDAYSLLTTGKDQWGVPWPITFRSFGDSKLPFYTYLTIPSVAIFGLNHFAVRLPNALVGVLAVCFIFLMTKILFKRKDIAYLSAFLLAISPWHIALSRGAFEANLTVAFMAFGVWSFYKGLKEKKWMWFSALAFGLNLFTYHSARLITPLIVGFLVWWNGISRKKLYPFSIFLLFLGIALYAVFAGGSSRAADITIFNPTDKWMAVFDRRYDAVFDGLSSQVARIFSNKLVYLFDTFTNAYSTYLSPQFLFTLGPAEWTYGMIAGHGVLYLFEALFVLTSLWFLAKYGLKESKGLTFLLVWILISPIPAALTKGPGYAGNRIAVMMPAITAFSAFGGLLLYEKLAFLKKKLLKWGFILLSLTSLVFFLEDYRFHAPRSGADGMLYGRKEAMEYVSKVAGEYQNIIVSRSLSEPQIYVAFYTKFDPVIYQKESADWLRYEEMGLPFVDQLGEYRLGKYTFKNINYIDDSKIPNVLIVGKPKEFPDGIAPVKAVLYPNQQPALYIVDPKSANLAKN